MFFDIDLTVRAAVARGGKADHEGPPIGAPHREGGTADDDRPTQPDRYVLAHVMRQATGAHPPRHLHFPHLS